MGIRRARTLALVLVATATFAAQPSVVGQRAAAPVEVPFDLVTRHIVVSATVGGSRPLSFVFDTGSSIDLLRLDTARELGLTFGNTVSVGGAGGGQQQGRFVTGATWSLVGLESVALPVRMALPLPELPGAFGQNIDGIVGGPLIERFVVEVDYQRQRLTFHDPASFRYDGSGETLPLEFDGGHPVVTATFTPLGGQPLERRFMLDLGSGGSLVLHSPFVADEKLLDSQPVTVPAIGAAGAGGRTEGQVGRADALQIGRFTIRNPMVMFSEDTAGAFANSRLAGNIGAQIANRFRLFFDYGRRRLIVEPSPAFDEPFDRAFSGLALRASAPDYRELSVYETMPSSPATEAGIEVGDVLLTIDGVAAGELGLSAVNERLERPSTFSLTFRRGDRTFTVSLTPKRMI